MSHNKLASTLLCTSIWLLGCSAPIAAPDTSNEGGVANSTMGAGKAGAASQSEPNWCDVQLVLSAKCQRCHTQPPENGAPFALLTYADTQVVDRAGTPRFQKMKAALETDYMPPQFLKLTPEVEPLTANERSTMLDWLAGQPPPDAECN